MELIRFVWKAVWTILFVWVAWKVTCIAWMWWNASPEDRALIQECRKQSKNPWEWVQAVDLLREKGDSGTY